MSAIRSLLPLCLAPALVAQTASPSIAVLHLVPATATAVELTWKLAESDARYRAALAPLGEKSGLVDLEGRAHLNLEDLAPGPVVEAHFEAPGGTKRTSKVARTTTEWKLLMVPVRSAKQLAAKLQAEVDGPLQHYRWKAGKDEQERFLAFRGGYALISEHREVLDLALKPGPSLESELAPLAPWMLAHDTVAVATEQTVRRALESAFRSGDGRKQPGMAPFKALIEKARASVSHAALALDLPHDGSLRLTGRAFFKADNPLAIDAAALPPLSGHPLGRLPEGPYALAMGGHWPLPLSLFQQAAGRYPSLDAKTQEEAAALAMRLNELQRSMAFRLRAPRTGEPLLLGLSGTAVLKDGQAWMAAMREQQAWFQAHLSGVFSFQEAVLADLPSITVNIDLAKLAEGKVPPAQLARFGNPLFGGNQFSISYAVVDGTTLAYTIGDREALKALVSEVRQSKPLAATKGIQAADALVPPDSRFLIYVDPSGFRTVSTRVIQALTGKAPDPAALEEVLPLVGAISMDPAGFQVCGGAHPKSLEAMARVFSGTSKAFPSKPTPGDPAAGR